MIRNAFTPRAVDSYHERFREVAKDMTVEDEPLSDDEFCNFFLLLMVAGNETTRTVTSHGTRLLMKHDQYHKLQQESQLLEGAIEEFLRYNPAVIAFRRTPMEDVEVGGQLIKKGDRVQVCYGAASADEDFFSDGDVFDIARAQREWHQDHADCLRH